MKFLENFEALVTLRNWFQNRSKKQEIANVHIKDSPGATVINNIYYVINPDAKGRGG